jgi:hydrogenase maturation factor
MVLTISFARPAAVEFVGISNEINIALINTFETLAFRLLIAISSLLHPPLLGSYGKA